MNTKQLLENMDKYLDKQEQNLIFWDLIAKQKENLAKHRLALSENDELIQTQKKLLQAMLKERIKK